MSNKKSVARRLENDRPGGGGFKMRGYLSRILEQMTPKYHEMTAYLTALTCAGLFVLHSELRQNYFAILSGAGAFAGGASKAGFAFIALLLIATIGFFLSVLHVFIRRKKSQFEKTCMGVFLMTVNGVAGIVAGIELLSSHWSILAILPAWNILMGVILLYQMALANFEISDENASLLEVFGASVTLLIVFAITDFGLRPTWAMEFSICVFYSSTIFFVLTWIINYFRLRPFTKS